METITHATNSDGDIFTLVVIDEEIFTLTVYEAYIGKSMTSIMRWLPEIKKWAELTLHGTGKIESNLTDKVAGDRVTQSWVNLQKHADEIVGM